MNRKNIYTTLAALLLLCACWNIKCESSLSTVHSGNELGTNEKIEKQQQQAHKFCEQQDVQQYIHENSKPYKKSLKQDTLFAQRLDSIKLLQSSFGEGTGRNVKVTSISEQKRK